MSTSNTPFPTARAATQVPRIRGSFTIQDVKKHYEESKPVVLEFVKFGAFPLFWVGLFGVWRCGVATLCCVFSLAKFVLDKPAARQTHLTSNASPNLPTLTPPLAVNRAESLKEWPAMSKWSFEMFADKYGDSEVWALTGLPQTINVPYNLDNDLFHKKHITLREAIKEITTDLDHICYIPQSSLEKYPGLNEDLRPEQITAFGPELRVENIWLGSQGTKSGWHFDLADNFLMQVIGTKHVLLVAPEDSQYMHAIPDLRHKSYIDPWKPEEFSGYSKAKLYECILKPGDVLVIPVLWWHFVTSLEPSISYNVWNDPNSMRSQYDQKYTFGQRLKYNASWYWEFTKSFWGFPRKVRLFSKPSDGVNEGTAWRNWLLSWIPRPFRRIEAAK